MDTNDFNAVLRGHASWLARFTAALASGSKAQFAPEIIRDHSSCVLGRWIEAHPNIYGNPDLYGTVRALHQTIHEIAAEIAEMLAADTPHETIQTYLNALAMLLDELAAFQILDKHEPIVEST
jgi:phosphohistidine phosphatase SixA